MSSSCGAPGLSSSNYDVSPDGQRFLMIQDDDVDKTSSSTVVVGFVLSSIVAAGQHNRAPEPSLASTASFLEFMPACSSS